MSLNKQKRRFDDNYSSGKLFSETKNLKTFLHSNYLGSLETAFLCKQSIFVWSARAVFRIKKLALLSIIFVLILLFQIVCSHPGKNPY